MSELLTKGHIISNLSSFSIKFLAAYGHIIAISKTSELKAH